MASIMGIRLMPSDVMEYIENIIDFKARIDIVSIEETVAVVRVLEENWGGRIDFTDYLLLLKIDGVWKCVAKAYNQNSDTIKK